MVTRKDETDQLTTATFKLADALGVLPAERVRFVESVVAPVRGDPNEQMPNLPFGNRNPLKKLADDVALMASEVPATLLAFEKADKILGITPEQTAARWQAFKQELVTPRPATAASPATSTSPATDATPAYNATPAEINKRLSDMREARPARLIRAMHAYTTASPALDAALKSMGSAITPEQVPEDVKEHLRIIDRKELKIDVNMGVDPTNNPKFFEYGKQTVTDDWQPWIYSVFNGVDPPRVETTKVDIRDVRTEARNEVGAAQDRLSTAARTLPADAERIKAEQMGPDQQVLPVILEDRARKVQAKVEPTDMYVTEYKGMAENAGKADGLKAFDEAANAGPGSKPNLIRDQKATVPEILDAKEELVKNPTIALLDVITAADKAKGAGASPAVIPVVVPPAPPAPAVPAPGDPRLNAWQEMGVTSDLDASQANTNGKQYAPGYMYQGSPQQDSIVEAEARTGRVAVKNLTKVHDSMVEFHAAPAADLLLDKSTGVNDSTRFIAIMNGDRAPGTAGPQATLVLTEAQLGQVTNIKQERAIGTDKATGQPVDFGFRTTITYREDDGRTTNQQIVGSRVNLAQRIGSDHHMTAPIQITEANQGPDDNLATIKHAVQSSASQIQEALKDKAANEGKIFAYSYDARGQKTGGVIVEAGGKTVSERQTKGTLVTFRDKDDPTNDSKIHKMQVGDDGFTLVERTPAVEIAAGRVANATPARVGQVIGQIAGYGTDGRLTNIDIKQLDNSGTNLGIAKSTLVGDYFMRSSANPKEVKIVHVDNTGHVTIPPQTPGGVGGAARGAG